MTIVFLHPSLTTADSTETVTDWLEFIDTADVSGDASKQELVLLAPEGRDTAHFYPAPDNVRWPADWLPAMLRFFRDHPLSAQ